MNCRNSRGVFALAALGLGALIIGSTGCATKKYVRNSVQESVQPLQVGLKNTEEKTDANAEQIRNVDRRAESGIAEAQNAASQANEAAGRADQHAQAAHQLAQQGVDAAGRAERLASNLDNYEPSRRATVLFGLNKSALTTDDKQSLDQLIQSVKALKHYVIQVQGYTDRTGPQQYNIQLSERRADAVVRYLTLTGNIPLVKIYRVGYGKDAPVAPNNTRAGRAKNRRVDVVVLVPQIAGEPGVPTAQASNPGSTP
jgi:outer membrane protein OmpA-like peptidoglycan-associated protein